MGLSGLAKMSAPYDYRDSSPLSITARIPAQIPASERKGRT